MIRLIAGSGRSGTTWVLDALASANALRPIFEPLRPESSAAGDAYAYRSLDPREEHADLAAYLSELQRSRSRSLWTTFRNPPDKLLPGISALTSGQDLRRAHYRWRQLCRSFLPLYRASLRGGALFKCIRANLALGWLAARMSARVVMVIRHPGAVVESQQRLSADGRSWIPWPVLERFRADKMLRASTSGADDGLLRRKLTMTEGLTLIWVIENQMPARAAQMEGYGVVHYEDLVDSPGESWARLCRQLELESLPPLASLTHPSQQASKVSLRPASGRETWRGRLSAEQLGEIQGVLDESSCDIYDVKLDRAVRPVIAPLVAA